MFGFTTKLSKQIKQELNHTRSRLVQAEGLQEVVSAEVQVYHSRIERLQREYRKALEWERDDLTGAPLVAKTQGELL